MEPSRSILLVYPEPVRRQALASALSGHKVVAVDSRQAAAEWMVQFTPDVILAHAGEAKRLLKEIEELAPRATRVFLGSSSDAKVMDALVDLAAQGHVFQTLDEDLASETLAKQLNGLVFRRNFARAPAPDGAEISFGLEGEVFRLPLSDIGNDGLGIRMPLAAPIEKFVPGALVVNLEISRQGAKLFRASRAWIRRVQTVRDGAEPFFLLGIELASSIDQPNGNARKSVRDPVRVLALLRRALRRGSSLLLKAADDPERQVEIREASIERTGGQGALHCGLPSNCELSLGDVVFLSFDLAGRSYGGWASILEKQASRITLSLPRAVVEQHRRNHVRFRPSGDRLFTVSFVSPLTGERIVRAVLDLHPRGLSFQLDAAREVLPVGLELTALDLVLPGGGSARCTAEVQSLSPVPVDPAQSGMSNPYRCGVRLLEVPPNARQAILDSFIALRHPSMEDGGKLAFRNIWEVVSASNAFYPDYPLGEGPHMAILEAAHKSLASSGEELGKTLVYRDPSGLAGHASGLRFYSRTWVLQHLAVPPGFHRNEQIGRELSSMVIDCAEALDGLDFVRILWRTDNRWPNRLAGWVAKTMAEEGLTLFRFVNYLRKPLQGGQESPAKANGLRIRRALPEDLRQLEAYFRANFSPVRIRSEDLGGGELEMPAQSERFAKAGLLRRRGVFVAESDEGLVAAALADEATPGLHWAEFTNAFSLVLLDPTHPRAPESRRVLLARCAEHYRSRGQAAAVVVASDSEVAEMEAAGFQLLGRFAEWTFHRSLVRTWFDLSMALFERLRRPQPLIGPAANDVSEARVA